MTVEFHHMHMSEFNTYTLVCVSHKCTSHCSEFDSNVFKSIYSSHYMTLSTPWKPIASSGAQLKELFQIKHENVQILTLYDFIDLSAVFRI